MSILTEYCKGDCAPAHDDENYDLWVNLKTRISQTRDLLGINQSELSVRCGVKPSAINKLESGETKKLSGELLLKLSDVLGVDPHWLAYGKEKFKSALLPSPPGGDRFPIRRALFKLSAGVSGYEIEYENGESRPIYMDKSWFEQRNLNPEKLISLKISGRSMEPRYNEGDLVIINTTSSAPKDGRPFAINYEGEMVIKRMRRDAGQWFITSDNPDKTRYADKVCAEGCFVLGEVIYLQTENAL